MNDEQQNKDEYGLAIAQEGIDFKDAADYNMVMDSRWRFLETEATYEGTVTIPAVEVDPVIIIEQKVNVLEHGLGFMPGFHGAIVDVSEYDNADAPELYADEKHVFVRRTVPRDTEDNGYIADEITMTVRVRVYNLPVLEVYKAPSLGGGQSLTPGTIGMQALDGSDSDMKLGEPSATGYSVDTRKKTMSIHMHGSMFVNRWQYDKAIITDIDTSTDTFTFEIDPDIPPEIAPDPDWIKTGAAIGQYWPDDFDTYPGGISESGNTLAKEYYIIKVSDTELKLAETEQDAFNGVAVDITSTGSLPAGITRAGTEDDFSVEHNLGYKPSYFICRPLQRGREFLAIAPFQLEAYVPAVNSDSRKLYFGGVMSLYSGWTVYVILKDPLELVR